MLSRKALLAFSFVLSATLISRAAAQHQQKKKVRLISVNFQETDIATALRLLAELSGKNIVLQRDVSGLISLRLNEVPWEQAFDNILRLKHLYSENVEGIIVVHPLE